MSNNWNALDIINSDEWGKSEYLEFFQDRLGKMESKRVFFDGISNSTNKSDGIWTSADNQINAVSVYDNEGSLQVSIPVEKSLIEIYMGRTDGKATFDIVPDGQANIEELQPAKYALNFFLDGNGKSNFWKENNAFRDGKAHYGSGIFGSDLKKIIDFNYVIKDDADIEANENILDEKNFNKVENVIWEFFPHNIHVRDFYIDDNAYGDPDVQKAEDCIYKENITATELEIRYGENRTGFDITGVNYSTDPAPKNNNSSSIDSRTITIYHYFHRITKKYLIVANRDYIIYNGRNLYNDGKLPFVNVQHYSNKNRFRGEGIPERVGYLKAYKGEIFQDILSGAEMASGVNLLTGNDDEIGQDWNIGGRGLNLWRTTGGAERVQPINTNINLGFFTTIIDLLEKQITIDTGINPLEQFDSISDKVGIVEIMEANKAIRNKSVDENYNIGLDSILTMTLARIKQFAPSLLATNIMSDDGKRVVKTEYFEIRIDNHKVERKGNKQIFTESMGKFGYFAMKPSKRNKEGKLVDMGTIQGIGVKIVTASTNSMLPLLERQKITEYLNNLTSLANVAALDQTGEMMNKLSKWTRFEELLQWMGDSYGYDINGLKANTEKDEIAKENLKMMENLKKVLTINDSENENSGQAPGLPTKGPVQNPGTKIQGDEIGASIL